MRTCHDPLDLVRERPPEHPVVLARPGAAALAARWFRANFQGDVLYAVKANPSPWLIRALHRAGIGAFDVASPAEMALIGEQAPGARLAFMHPVKSRVAIARAYHDFGVRVFALDSPEELDKIAVATGEARDLTLIVRLAVATRGAAYALGGKFGVEGEASAPLLLASRRRADRMGVSFHVGSQCMAPAAFRAALAQASRMLARAGVLADIVDVGGGFPSIYPGMTPPPMADYLAAIEAGFAEMAIPETAELWCEPGRALCAEASSLLARVELRKDHTLYLNDGAFGSLYDAAHVGWRFPAKRLRAGGEEGASPLAPFAFFGPTCDAADHMPGPFWLPDDVAEGDYIEIGMLGAYGVALRTRFNGFGEVETVATGDAPMATMYGLAAAALPDPRSQSPESAAR